MCLWVGCHFCNHEMNSVVTKWVEPMALLNKLKRCVASTHVIAMDFNPLFKISRLDKK